MRTITPRAKFTIECPLTPQNEIIGKLGTPRLMSQTDLEVTHADMGTMFLNMARHHFQETSESNELIQQFLSFMEYHTDLANPGVWQPVELLYLDPRFENALINNGIRTIPKLKREFKHLTSYPGIGRGALKSITKALQDYV